MRVPMFQLEQTVPSSIVLPVVPDQLIPVVSVCAAVSACKSISCNVERSFYYEKDVFVS